MRLPDHIGIIPDGNRRWAESRGITKEKGYAMGLDPGLVLFKQCKDIGIKEITSYGFTTDNTKRPTEQRIAFTDACIQAVGMLSQEDAALLVLGNTDSPMFPKELLPYTTRKIFGKGEIKVNFLVNYGWEWDLGYSNNGNSAQDNNNGHKIKSHEISRMDLIIRWGGRTRLSGFLPVQSVYSDIFVVEEYWPDFKPEHLHQAINWYQRQDITLGG
ncbi:MAG: dihydroorotate dehydrogenase [Chloroflexi bacterium HGW-Chloroflexi-10]|nr:MAG: dihydroorotate dehydrogenase [Chloroflexi bacterium HGW-Chloroflexi-10]